MTTHKAVGVGSVASQGHTGEAMRWLLREYLAMPGLSLTLPQIRRLLALDEAACETLLELLARTGYLVRRKDGRCVRSPRVELAAWRRAVQTVLSDTQIEEEAAMALHDEDHRVDASAGRLASAVEIDRILCPIDFSANSLRALTHATGIARRYGSSITALHVIEAGAGTTAAHEVDVLDRLHEFVNATDQGAVFIEAVVTRGSVVSRIVEHAKSVAANLLVVGPGRWSDDERLPLESVTQALLLSAPCPVLAIPRHSRNPVAIKPAAFTRVLCAVDFSTASTQALRYAASIAAQFRSRLQVLHVLDLTSQAREAAVLALGDRTSWRDLEAAALRHLHAGVPDDVRRMTAFEEVIGVGSPAREILHAAREMSADVIVMGAQSRAGFELLRFGSAAHGVVRDALCPVLLTRGAHIRPAERRSEKLDVRVQNAAATLVPARG